MKKFNFSAIIIIGLLFNLIPFGAYAAESNEKAPHISMTFDYEEFISSNDEETIAVATTAAAIITTTTTSTQEETTTTNTTTVTFPSIATTEATTAGGNDYVPTTEPPAPSIAQTTSTIPKFSTTNTTASTTNTSTTNSTCLEPSIDINANTNKFMIFCSLSLTNDKNNLLMTVKTQAKRVVDSIGFSDITLSKFDKNKQLISETSLKDMSSDNVSVFSEDIPLEVEGGYFYQISGYHTVTVSGYSKTLFNQSDLIFAEELSQPPSTTAFNVYINNNTTTTIASDPDISEKPPVTTGKNVYQHNTPPTSQAASANSLYGNTVSPINKPAASTIFKAQSDHSSSKNPSNAVQKATARKTTSRLNSNKNSTQIASLDQSSPDTGDSGTAFGGLVLSLLFAAVLMVKKIETE